MFIIGSDSSDLYSKLLEFISTESYNGKRQIILRSYYAYGAIRSSLAAYIFIY